MQSLGRFGMVLDGSSLARSRRAALTISSSSDDKGTAVPAPMAAVLALVIAAFLALSVLLVLASSALAARGHVFERTIGEPCTAEPCGPGQLKEPEGLAVNEATGASTQSISSAFGRPHSSHPEALRSTSRVRGCSVLDQGNDRVQRFGSRGAPA